MRPAITQADRLRSAEAEAGGPIRIRVAHTGDSGAVEQVLLASYPALMAGAYDEELLARALPLMTRANPRLLASGTYYLAEIEGEPVGCGGWTCEEPGSGLIVPGVAHIRHFGVAERFIGRGIGRALFARCVADAQQLNVRRLDCYASLNGKPFYEALGFVFVSLLSVSMGPDIALPSVLMRQALSSAD